MFLQIVLINLVAFLDLFAVGIIVPLIGNHVKQLGGSPVLVGLMGSVYAGFQLASGPLIGSLSDIKGRKHVLIYTVLCSAFAYMGIGFYTSFVMLLFLRIVLGIFKQTQMLTKALVPDYEKDEAVQSNIYGKMAAISGAGMTLGPVVGGHIMEDFPQYGFQFAATLAGCIFIGNAVLIYFGLNSEKRKSKHLKKQQNKHSKNVNYLDLFSTSIKESLAHLLSVDWAAYGDIFLFKALVGFSMGVYYSNYSLLLREKFDLSPKYIGYTISFQGTIGSFCSFLIYYVNLLYRSDHDYTKRNFHCFLFMAISLIGLTMTSYMPVFLFWLVPLAICNAVARLVTLDMVLKRSTGEHRGKLIGASNSIRSLSGVVAPLVAGVLTEKFGLSSVLYASVSSALLGLIVSLYAYLNGSTYRTSLKKAL